VAVLNYIVCERDDLWEVRFGDRLLVGQPSQAAALDVAETLAQVAADRGELAKILIGAFDGSLIEYRTIEPPRRPTVA
jgi:hypothetical protein